MQRSGSSGQTANGVVRPNGNCKWCSEAKWREYGASLLRVEESLVLRSGLWWEAALPGG